MGNCFEIALYDLLKRIPDAIDGEVQRAVADIASSKDIATKADVKVEVGRMGRVLIMWMVGVGVAVIGIIIAVLK